MLTLRVPTQEFVHAAIQAGQHAGFLGAIILLARTAHKTLAKDWVRNWSDTDDITANDIMALCIGFAHEESAVRVEREVEHDLVNVTTDHLAISGPLEGKFARHIGKELSELMKYAKWEPSYHGSTSAQSPSVDSHGITEIRRSMGIAEGQLPALLIISFPTSTEHLVELAGNPSLMPSEVVRRIVVELDDLPHRHKKAAIQASDLSGVLSDHLRLRDAKEDLISNAQRTLARRERYQNALAELVCSSLCNGSDEIRSAGSYVANWIRSQHSTHDVPLDPLSKVIAFVESNPTPNRDLVGELRALGQKSHLRISRKNDALIGRIPTWRAELGDLEREISELRAQHDRAEIVCGELAAKLTTCFEDATTSGLSKLGFVAQVQEPLTSRLRTVYAFGVQLDVASPAPSTSGYARGHAAAPTFNINIHGSTIGGLAVGDGSSVNASVSMFSPAPPPAAPALTPAARTTAGSSTTPATGLQSVYLSYGPADEPFVERLFHALEVRGVATFYFPEHAPAGQKLHRTARVGVNQHDRVLLVCSRASLSDLRVQNDLEQTLDREAREGGSSRLIPVNLDNFARSPEWQPPHPDVIHEIQGRVMVEMVGAERDARKFEQGIERLIRALKG